MDNNPFNTGFKTLVGQITKTEYFQPERKKDKPYGEITIRVKDFGFQELINRLEKDADLIIQIQSWDNLLFRSNSSKLSSGQNTE